MVFNLELENPSFVLLPSVLFLKVELWYKNENFFYLFLNAGLCSSTLSSPLT